MAIKKSELYSSLWASCDALRGRMDPSQYKDYVLVMLFIKYISDKWAGQRYAPIEIPEGASFRDMVALKGKPDIGDQINKKIIGPIALANKLSDMPDFNDVSKLGSGKEMVELLTSLIIIFEKPELNFSKNEAEGDDILGDAYEYLMQHFAKDSGKSKGQFYTPAEVSRLIAKIIGIKEHVQAVDSTTDTTVYDPTCGSGSLLLKLLGEVKGKKVSLYGQEMDAATSGLAKMNLILHNCPGGLILQGNTLANPLFKDADGSLKTFDFVVANPPFSDKRWSTGLTLPEDEPFRRFTDFGVPPDKNGDYAFLLHVLRSLKSKGKGAIILPHGVLFRGNAEAEIRKNLLRHGVIKAVIGLPANLFYGTGIPAAIILLDKENAAQRKAVFIVDAGKGFIKDGNKNRLREQDLHKIADVVNAQKEIPGFSKLVPLTDIEANEYNLNIPRYIENQDGEDLHDLSAHLQGGMPEADITALGAYWEVFPSLKATLFVPGERDGFFELKLRKDETNDAILQHPEFVGYTKDIAAHFGEWSVKKALSLRGLTEGFNPKDLIYDLSEHLLEHFQGKALIDPYNLYQHLMTFWGETMQDDAYLISAAGWKADTYRIVVENKGKVSDKGWTCDLVPKDLVTNRYFSIEKETIDLLIAEKERTTAEIAEMEEEHSGEEGFFSDFKVINRSNVADKYYTLTKNKSKTKAKPALLKVAEPAAAYGTEGETDAEDEATVLKRYLHLCDALTQTKKDLTAAESDLDDKLYAKYPTLTVEEIKDMVVNDKWIGYLTDAVTNETERVGQNLTQRIKTLAERYESPLPQLTVEAKTLEETVLAHLFNLGLSWK